MMLEGSSASLAGLHLKERVKPSKSKPFLTETWTSPSSLILVILFYLHSEQRDGIKDFKETM